MQNTKSKNERADDPELQSENDVLRRMLTMPPKPHEAKPAPTPKKKKAAK